MSERETLHQLLWAQSLSPCSANPTSQMRGRSDGARTTGFSCLHFSPLQNKPTTYSCSPGGCYRSGNFCLQKGSRTLLHGGLEARIQESAPTRVKRSLRMPALEQRNNIRRIFNSLWLQSNFSTSKLSSCLSTARMKMVPWTVKYVQCHSLWLYSHVWMEV